MSWTSWKKRAVQKIMIRIFAMLEILGLPPILRRRCGREAQGE